MARTRQTARKSTGGRVFACRTPIEPAPAPAPPSPTPAQLEEEDEEVPGRDYFFDEDENGRIMEVDEEGNMTSPLPSPTLAQEDLAPPPEDPVPAAAGGDLSDPGEDDEDPIQYDGYYSGGMWDDSDAEEEPLELKGGPGAPDGGDENSVNPPALPRDARQPPEFWT